MMLAASGLLTPLDWRIEDALSHFDRREAPDIITIVGIDRQTLGQIGDRAFEPATRARAIKNLIDAGAKRIFADFGMAQIGSQQTMAEIATIFGTDVADRVAFPVFRTSRQSSEGISIVEGEPDPGLQALTSLASVSVPIDADGVARRIFESIDHNGKRIVGVPLWLTQDDSAAMPELRVNFSIDLDSIESMSFVDILNNNFDKAALKDRLVIVGATDLVLGDQLVTPRYSVIAGVEFLALATATHLQNIVLHELDFLAVILLTALATTMSALIFRSVQPVSISLLALTITVTILITAAITQTQFQLLIQPAAPVAGVIMAAIIAALQRTGWMARRQQQSDLIIDDQAAMIGRFLAGSRDGIVTISPQGRIMNANDAMLALWGGDPTGLDFQEIVPSIDDIEVSAANQESSIVETSLLTAGEQCVAVELAFNRSQRMGDPVTIAMLRDVRLRKAHEKQLTELATQDTLTGLANRYSLEKTLRTYTKDASGTGGSIAMLLVDLDQFKEVNDTLGHSIGDSLLVAVAERIRSFSNSCRIVSRLGGDEFALVIDSGLPPESLHELGRELYGHLTTSYSISGMSLELGASIGIARYPDDAEDDTKLMQCADIAMYEAKRLGGGVRLYDAESDQNSVRRLTLKGQLRQAIEDDQLVLFYQPKVCPKTGKILGSEALVRWIHPELGFMPPDEFIPAAEQSGIINPLTVWSFRKALLDKQSFPPHLSKLPISVNVSARLFGHQDIVDSLNDVVGSFGMSPCDLTIEITESAIMTHIEQSLHVLHQLKSSGYKLSLDDFGAGYSSFDYLRRLPIHELKIDRAFLVARNEDIRAGEVLSGMIGLGHRLGLSVVCEGVETHDELEWLRKIDCDVIQGYLTGKPMDPIEFAKLSSHLPEAGYQLRLPAPSL